MQALLDLGADSAAAGLDGNSALHTAAMLQDAQYLRLLLAKGAQVNVRNAVTGATPLAAAVLAGREEQLRLLLAAGADTTLSDRLGDTPLHLAAKINAPHWRCCCCRPGPMPGRATSRASRSSFISRKRRRICRMTN